MSTIIRSHLQMTMQILDIIFQFKFTHSFDFNNYSGVARAFPGERPAHLEPQSEEENEEKLRKDERKSRSMRRNWGNVAFLPTRGWESGYAPE